MKSEQNNKSIQEKIKKNSIQNVSLSLYNKQLLPPKIVGEIKHYIPANKEWKNSVYTYNKNYSRNFPSKNNLAIKLIKSYFYLSNNKGLARSKRMRNLIRRRSDQLFHLSNFEVKQTNDKVILTIHIFNREKQTIMKKVLFFNRRRLMLDLWRKKNNLYLNNLNYLLIKKLATKRALENSTYVSKYIDLTKRTLKRRNLHSKLFYKNRSSKQLYKTNRNRLIKNKRKQLIPSYGIKFKSEVNLFTLKTHTKNNFLTSLRKKFYFNFIKYVLSMFNVKIAILPFSCAKLCFIINNTSYCFNTNFNGLMDKENKNYVNIDYTLKNLNFFLSLFLDSVLEKSNIRNKEKKLNLLFKAFFKKYFSVYIANVKKKKVLLSNSYVKLMINGFKLSKFLPGLKLLISKIYNKKVELNIIDLKYLHLNTEIFTKSIAKNLTKKISPNILLKKCLELVEIPRNYLSKSKIYDINKIRKLDRYESLKLSSLKVNTNLNERDYLQYTLKKIYPCSLIAKDKSLNRIIYKEENTSSKLISVLNTIRYKWVAGVRLETAGRLTRRFAAARSVSKFMYKGSLKNIDYSRKLSFSDSEPSEVSVRNHAKSNSQYTLAKSKKRIGAFGIKGWISGY